MFVCKFLTFMGHVQYVGPTGGCPWPLRHALGWPMELCSFMPAESDNCFSRFNLRRDPAWSTESTITENGGKIHHVIFMGQLTINCHFTKENSRFSLGKFPNFLLGNGCYVAM